MRKTNNPVAKALANKENLVDILSTAFYGNYNLYAYTPDEFRSLKKPESECREDVWADILLQGKYIMVVDDEEGAEHELDLPKLVQGLEKVMIEQPKVFGRIMSFDGDADMIDADCVIQYAIFGEYVYG